MSKAEAPPSKPTVPTLPAPVTSVGGMSFILFVLDLFVSDARKFIEIDEVLERALRREGRVIDNITESQLMDGASTGADRAPLRNILNICNRLVFRSNPSPSEAPSSTSHESFGSDCELWKVVVEVLTKSAKRSSTKAKSLDIEPMMDLTSFVIKSLFDVSPVTLDQVSTKISPLKSAIVVVRRIPDEVSVVKNDVAKTEETGDAEDDNKEENDLRRSKRNRKSKCSDEFEYENDEAAADGERKNHSPFTFSLTGQEGLMKK